MSRHPSSRRAGLRFTATAAITAAGALALGACSHQAATPGAAAPGTGSASSSALPFKKSSLGASVFVVNTISDLDAFEKFFESGSAEREAGSVSGYLLSRLGDGRIVVHLLADDLDRVQAALNSAQMQGYLNRAGAPDASLVWVTRDVSVSLPVTPPPGKTYSLYFKLKVGDFDAFKNSFEARDSLYAAHGVVGRGLHQSTSERNVVIHFVGTDRAELEALTKDPEFEKLLALAEPEGAAKPFLGEDLLRSRPK
jgi:hypothetical protein